MDDVGVGDVVYRIVAGVESLFSVNGVSTWAVAVFTASRVRRFAPGLGWVLSCGGLLRCGGLGMLMLVIAVLGE